MNDWLLTIIMLILIVMCIILLGIGELLQMILVVLK